MLAVALVALAAVGLVLDERSSSAQASRGGSSGAQRFGVPDPLQVDQVRAATSGGDLTLCNSTGANCTTLTSATGKITATGDVQAGSGVFIGNAATVSIQSSQATFLSGAVGVIRAVGVGVAPTATNDTYILGSGAAGATSIFGNRSVNGVVALASGDATGVQTTEEFCDLNGCSIAGTLKFTAGAQVNTKSRGTIALVAGSGTATVNGSAFCTCVDATANASVKCAVAGTTLTATGTGTDSITYICVY